MKTKLLTICLLLFTSQVFAKEFTVFKCSNDKETRACSNCTKTNIKLRVNVDEVNETVKLIYINKHNREILSLREYTKETTATTAEWTTLSIFDENNWQYQMQKYINKDNKFKSIYRYLELIDGKIFHSVDYNSIKGYEKYQCAK